MTVLTDRSMTPVASMAGSDRLRAAMARDLAGHLALVGPLPALSNAAALVAEVRAAGLTGHGGAGFPTWRKLETVAAGRNPVVIANGAEGEPASGKDRALLEQAPHLVLDGLQVAAAATGATMAYAYVRASAQAVLRRALAERSDRVKVEIVTAAESFVSGQETAVVAAIEGGRPVPRDVPDLVVRNGVRGRPTLVQNVETLAQLALLARHGAAWFRQVGTLEQPGTFLATVSGSVRRPGVHEAAYGVPLADLLSQAGGPAEPLQAVLVGGYHGVWLPQEALSAPMSVEGLAPWGGTPGAGVVVALGRSESGLAATAKIAAYLAGESARQCGPCLNGLPAMATVLGRMAHGEKHPDLPRQVEWLTRVVEGRGACHHPDGTARMVRSALALFNR
ncbi:MAG: SLBB domain-containing protein [Actinomycetota bacterium]|nr:SLBB domain-containing protein [Actinomycetota bacterium]